MSQRHGREARQAHNDRRHLDKLEMTRELIELREQVRVLRAWRIGLLLAFTFCAAWTAVRG